MKAGGVKISERGYVLYHEMNKYSVLMKSMNGIIMLLC